MSWVLLTSLLVLAAPARAEPPMTCPGQALGCVVAPKLAPESHSSPKRPTPERPLEVRTAPGVHLGLHPCSEAEGEQCIEIAIHQRERPTRYLHYEPFDSTDNFQVARLLVSPDARWLLVQVGDFNHNVPAVRSDLWSLPDLVPVALPEDGWAPITAFHGRSEVLQACQCVVPRPQRGMRTPLRDGGSVELPAMTTSPTSDAVCAKRARKRWTLPRSAGDPLTPAGWLPCR